LPKGPFSLRFHDLILGQFGHESQAAEVDAQDRDGSRPGNLGGVEHGTVASEADDNIAFAPASIIDHLEILSPHEASQIAGYSDGGMACRAPVDDLLCGVLDLRTIKMPD
jgi:hypothetical protein